MGEKENERVQTRPGRGKKKEGKGKKKKAGTPIQEMEGRLVVGAHIPSLGTPLVGSFGLVVLVHHCCLFLQPEFIPGQNSFPSQREKFE